MNKKFKGSFYLLTATMIWGSAFIAQSVGMELIGPFTFQFIRSGLAVLFLFSCSLAGKHGIRHSLHKWTDQKLWKSGLICGCALFTPATLQQVGLVYTDAGKAGFITSMYIVLVPVLGVFLKRRPPRKTLPCILMAVAGLYLLSCLGATQINIGDLLLMGCALSYAVQIICIDHFAADVDGLRLNCIQCLVVMVLSLPMMLLTETIVLADIAACWFPLAYAGIASMGVAYTFQILGQQNMEPTAASLIMSLESVIAALCGWLLLNETMTGTELLGCALVFASVIISQLPEKRRKKGVLQNSKICR